MNMTFSVESPKQLFIILNKYCKNLNFGLDAYLVTTGIVICIWNDNTFLIIYNLATAQS